jgi:RNA recognition motif. (a.k.a. RRM, RBD, or RNP domain)
LAPDLSILWALALVDLHLNDRRAVSCSLEESRAIPQSVFILFNEEDLKAYFSEFGPIEECRMKEDKLTSSCVTNSDKFRGFGFIRFKDARSVQLVLSRKHTIKGNLLDVKKAITKEENEKHVNDELLRKIFLAHINSKLTECKYCA